MRKIIILMVILSASLQSVEHDYIPSGIGSEIGCWVPSGPTSFTLSNVGCRFYGVTGSSLALTFTINTGTDWYHCSTTFNYTTGWASGTNYSHYWYNGSYWIDLAPGGIAGFPPDSGHFQSIPEGYPQWLTDNSFSAGLGTFSAYLDGYNPAGPTASGDPTDGPQAPPPGWDFDWEYKPGDELPESGMSLFDAVTAGVISPEQYHDLLDRGFAPTDQIHYYSEQGPNSGIIIGRANWPSGYRIHWQYNPGGAGWQSGGSMDYSPGESGWVSSGPWQPPTQAPPSAPPPENENGPGDITNEQNTATGSDELEELERLNDNVNNVADTVDTAAQALLDQGEDTQDMLAAQAAAQAARDDIRDEELKESNRIARQQLNELQKMNAKMEQVREAVEGIETGGGGGTGGEVTVDGEIGEYDAFAPGDSGLTTTSADGLASSIGAVVGPHAVDFSGPATSFSFSIPMPSGDPYAVVLPLVPQTGNPLGDALDLFRIIVRLCLAVILFYIFSVSVIKTIRT